MAVAAPGLPSAPACGTILTVGPDGIAVAAQNSIVFITELQRPGGRRMSLAEFQRGFELRVGMVFEKRTA
jgi:methionyl-tRNA formyltransferase